MDKKYAPRSYADAHELASDLEHAVNNKNLHHLLQVFAEGVDLTAPLPTSVGFMLSDYDVLNSSE